MERYPHLRHTTAIPTHEERDSIAASQRTLQATCSSLKTEIDGLRERLELSLQELAVVEAEVNLYFSITSSIRRLPPDVLVTIFAYAISATFVRLSDITFAAPWTLF